MDSTSELRSREKTSVEQKPSTPVKSSKSTVDSPSDSAIPTPEQTAVARHLTATAFADIKQFVPPDAIPSRDGDGTSVSYDESLPDGGKIVTTVGIQSVNGQIIPGDIRQETFGPDGKPVPGSRKAMGRDGRERIGPFLKNTNNKLSDLLTGFKTKVEDGFFKKTVPSEISATGLVRRPGREPFFQHGRKVAPITPATK